MLVPNRRTTKALYTRIEKMQVLKDTTWRGQRFWEPFQRKKPARLQPTSTKRYRC